MSSRQRSRLSNMAHLQKKTVHKSQDSESEEDEEGAEIGAKIVKKAAFVLMSSSSDSDSDSRSSRGSDDQESRNVDNTTKASTVAGADADIGTAEIDSTAASVSQIADGVTSLDAVGSDDNDSDSIDFIALSSPRRQRQRGGRKKTKKSAAAALAANLNDADKPIDGDAGEDEEHKFLDSLLQEQREQRIHEQQQISDRLLAAHHDESIRRQLLFTIDTKDLDIDAVQRRRFGGLQDLVERDMGAAGGVGQPQRGLGRRSNASHINRRLLFGQPRENWMKPPAYGLGGIGMEKIDTAKAAAVPAVAAAATAAEPSVEGDQSESSIAAGGAVAQSAHSGSGGKDAATQWFQFVGSKDFEFLNSQYAIIERSGDINLIIMFLAHFPYHPRAFLQVAALYARTGRMDRATDLVRRVLYLFECAALESFKPHNGGRCRMDPSLPLNGDYFEAMHQYVLHSAMQGCFSVAAEATRVLLSLHPTDDRFALLLMLDSFLVAAGRAETILAYCGIRGDAATDAAAAMGAAGATASAAAAASAAAEAAAVVRRVRHHIEAGYDLDSFSSLTDVAADGDNSSGDTNWKRRPPLALQVCFKSAYKLQDRSSRGDADDLCIGLEALPNWWFSLALAVFQAEEIESNFMQYGSSSRQQVPQTAAEGAHDAYVFIEAARGCGTRFHCPLRGKKVSCYLLQAALLRWPFMLLPLLQQCDVAASAQWQEVAGTSFFRDAEHRLLEAVADVVSRANASSTGGAISSCCLMQIAHAFATRSAAQWKREEVLNWLRQCCADTIGEMRLLNGQYDEKLIIDKHRTYYNSLLATPTSYKSGGINNDDNSSSSNHQVDCDQYNPLIEHYSRIQLEDFLEEIPRFPNDLDLIEPQLQEPDLLAGGVRFQDFMDDNGRFLNPWLIAQQQLQQQHGNNGFGAGAAALNGAAVGVLARRAQRQMRQWWAAVVGDEDNEEHLAADDADAILQQLAQRHQQQQRQDRDRWRQPVSYIDLNLPLVQLFIATLFPWVNVSPPAHRRR